MSRRGSFDVVGLGLNSTDTLIRLPRFPAPDSKMEILSADLRMPEMGTPDLLHRQGGR
jgi:hypothetical protein